MFVFVTGLYKIRHMLMYSHSTTDVTSLCHFVFPLCCCFGAYCSFI